MPLQARRGRLTRLIDVPLCQQCAAELRRKSGEEERLERIGRLAAALAGIAILILSLLLTPNGLPFVLWLLVAIVLSIGTGLLVLAYFRKRSLVAANPEKLAILASVKMTHFSWRAATFEFDSDEFARRFESMNHSRLMENIGNGSTES